MTSLYEEHKTNFYVEVDPIFNAYTTRSYGDDYDRLQEAECRRVLEEINRHVDSVHCYIIYETEKRCKFCHRSWTPDEFGYNGCCDGHDAAYYERNTKYTSEE